MLKFVLGVITGLLLAGLAVIIVVFAAIRMGGDRKPAIADSSTLVLRLEGAVPEQSPLEAPLPFLESREPLTVLETWSILRRAASDSRIKAVVFEPRNLAIGWAKMQQIRESLAGFKKSGKPIYAFLRGAGTREYYLATAADRIYMAPEDMLDVKGLRAELLYLKGGLDKLGVKVELEAVGRYKDGGDMFTRTNMRPETREVLSGILDQYYGDLISTIGEGRRKDSQAVRALIDEGPFQGKAALSGGLVDALAFEDQVFGDLKDRLKSGEIRKLSHQDYRKGLAGERGKKLAVVIGQGEITRGSSTAVSDDGITAAGLVKLLRDVKNDSSIQGVILRVDSPGGDGIASDDILHEVREVAKKKPLVISMSDLAASGGYFIAASGDPIVAYPNTITGSIGVFFGKLNLRGLYDKLGITKDAMSRGRFANIDSDYVPLTDAERAKLRKEIESFYSGFVQRVAESRKRPYGEVEPLAQGRVWLGSQAKKNGLIDELGGLDRALELLKQKAKIGAGEAVTLVTYPPKRTVWDLLFSRQEEAAMLESRIMRLTGGVPLRALAQGGILKLMPFSLTVH
jgi:protease-4